jgi:hypothetical protein
VSGAAAAEYEALANLQVELVDLIGQFGTALATLEPAWTRALLHRTHLDDPDFLAHISSTMSLVTSALRTKTPMPFYNRPLLATCERIASVVSIMLTGKHTYSPQDAISLPVS